MIIHLNKNISKPLAKEIAQKYEAVELLTEDMTILITPHTVKKVDEKYLEYIDKSWVFDNDMQLASKKYSPEIREIQIGKFSIGGKSNNTLLTIGPCGVESKEQITQTAELIKECGLHTIRAGGSNPAPLHTAIRVWALKD